MRKPSFDYCGIAYLNLNMLLDVKKEDELIRIISHLENFVVETLRFAT